MKFALGFISGLIAALVLVFVGLVGFATGVRIMSPKKKSETIS